MASNSADHLEWIAANGYERVTEREIMMIGMMNEITDKPDWHNKILSPEIVTKWEAEARVLKMSEPMINWCLNELRDKAEMFRKTGVVTALDIYYPIAKSDSAVNDTLKEEIRSTCEELRECTVDDWHPGSNNQVLDLIHPSLYPLVYARTRVLDDSKRVALDGAISYCGSGAPLEYSAIEEQYDHGDENESGMELSKKFQWLPCEVLFDDDGKLKITSYINNLHPDKFRPMYGVIERLIQSSIPVLNKALRHEIGSSHAFRRIECDNAEYDTPNPDQILGYKATDEEQWAEVRRIAEPEGVEYWMRNDEYLCDECDEDEDYTEWLNDEYNKWTFIDCVWKQKRIVIHPEPLAYETAPKPWLRYKKTNEMPPVGEIEVPEPVVDLQTDFKEKGLQIIVKIAGIELTPDKPEYQGGTWHLEGMANERIVATALYYYDCENVSDSRLHFRQRADMDPSEYNNEQSDHGGLEEIFGLPKGGLTNSPAIQNLGSVLTKEGRLLAFPNVLQHRVGSFSLLDPLKPGHRRFVALWLIDPYNRITSTANVPPQQYEWWAEALLQSTKFDEKLPPEVAEMVFKQGEEFMMTPEEAKNYRLELMEERTRGNATTDREWTEEIYNFCEH